MTDRETGTGRGEQLEKADSERREASLEPDSKRPKRNRPLPPEGERGGKRGNHPGKEGTGKEEGGRRVRREGGRVRKERRWEGHGGLSSPERGEVAGRNRPQDAGRADLADRNGMSNSHDGGSSPDDVEGEVSSVVEETSGDERFRSGTDASVSDPDACAGVGSDEGGVETRGAREPDEERPLKAIQAGSSGGLSGEVLEDGDSSEEISTEELTRDSGPQSFLHKHVRGTGAELRVIQNAVRSAYQNTPAERYMSVGRHLIVHVYYSTAHRAKRLSGEGAERSIPISYRLIRRACKEAGLPRPSSTQEVWAPLERAGLLIVERYIFRRGSPGRSRCFQLSDQLMADLSQAVEEGCGKKTRYNLIETKRIRKTKKTDLTYDGEHSWKERSVLIHRVLGVLRGQRDLLNKEAVEQHLRDLKSECDRTRRRYEKAKRRYYASRLVAEDDNLSRLCDDCLEASRDFYRARARYDQDLRIWSEINAQGLEPAPDQPENVYQYETAYEVQEASGRLTMVVGLQSASKTMKAAAAKGIPGYHNYDIASSQTEGLIQEMQEAAHKGSSLQHSPLRLDPSLLEDYPGKDELARRYGIDREQWKRPEHAVKFGAGFTHETFEAARPAAKGRVLDRIEGRDGNPQWGQLHRLPYESGEMAWERAVYKELPTMSQVAQNWAEDPDVPLKDPEEAYGLLKQVFGPMAEAIAEWREWLMEEHWSLEGQRGGTCGYSVQNPCGLSFSIHDERLIEDGEVNRYKQKAAYATSRLQGLEAAYIHALTILSYEYDYEVLRNEHDGAVVLGEISDDARRKARDISGFYRARLEEKPFNNKAGAALKTEAEQVTREERKSLSEPVGRGEVQSARCRPSLPRKRTYNFPEKSTIERKFSSLNVLWEGWRDDQYKGKIDPLPGSETELGEEIKVISLFGPLSSIIPSLGAP